MTRHNGALNHTRDLEHAATVNAAVRNSVGAEVHVTITGCDPADARLLRGIPAVGGRGALGGAIIGSRPDTSSTVFDSPRRRI